AGGAVLHRRFFSSVAQRQAIAAAAKTSVDCGCAAELPGVRQRQDGDLRHWCRIACSGKRTMSKKLKQLNKHSSVVTESSCFIEVGSTVTRTKNRCFFFIRVSSFNDAGKTGLS